LTAAPQVPSTLPSIAVPQDPGLAALERLQQRQAEQLSLQERQDRINQLQQTMSQQANDLLSSWSPPATQHYQAAEKDTQANERIGSENAGFTASQQALANAMLPPIKAGCVMFGVINTSLNSDEPSPILATVVDGRCENDRSTNAFVRCPQNIDGICNNGGYFNIKGAKLVGSFQRVDKKVIVSFNIMNVPGLPQSIPIDAVAIDPNTARTALADHVDSHYLLRFGTLFATSFISGLGRAIEQSGSTTNISLAGISQTFQETSLAQQAAIALGNTGQRFGEVLASTFNRPPTVEVDAGTGIGLLFRADVAATQGATTAAANPAVQPVSQPPAQPTTVPLGNTSNQGTAAAAPPTAIAATANAINQAQQSGFLPAASSVPVPAAP
jgi:intracellular multiplication protein IcmE